MSDLTFENQKIIEVDVEKEMKKSFLDYSMSVIVSRALPDVRDGLKPVHRRILYTMYENALWPEKAYRKCADTVGTVLGRYHPHGDSSVYDAMVRLAQDFSMRYMLVDGHGNFGSVDGDPPAAYRYTESRMSKVATEMLTDIEKDTVDFAPNYDDRLKEPTVLPSRFPNLLVNGSMGIAVGMATSIPPHNMGEAIDALCCLIDNPDATLDDLMQYIKGPDFPTAGIIMGRSGIRAAYGTGRGKITVRARTEIEETKNGRFKIIVTELPYQVNKARLIENIADMVKDKRLDGISNIEDHSDREGMRIVIDVKRDASPQVVLNNLFAATQLQSTFGAILLAIVNGEPKILTLKSMLEEYLRFQLEVIYRRTVFDLKKAEERAHILEALCKAIDFIDEVIAILRAAKSIPEGKAALMERFEFDEVQATAIVQMRLGQLTGLERDKLEEELAQLVEKIADYKDILSNEQRRRTIVRDESQAIKARFNDERRTEIVTVSGEVDIEDLIAEESSVVTLTNFGYVKRQKLDVYQTQHRGGRGIAGMSRRDEDVAREMFVGSSHDHVLFFSNRGRVYHLRCYEIPDSSRTGKGVNIVNLLPIAQDEKITAMICVSRFAGENLSLAMVTRKGYIKRTAFDSFKTQRKGGLIAIDLDEDDELAWVKLTDGSAQLIVATKNGMAIRFNESDVRLMGRNARGVRAIRMEDDDCVVGMSVLREGGKVLTVTETGFGRLSPADDYRVQSRAGKGIKNYRTNLYGNVAAIKVVDDQDDVIIISSNGIIIRVSVEEIRLCARPSKGVRVMRTDDTNKIVAIARVPHDENEETAKIEDDGTADEGAAETDEEIAQNSSEQSEEN